MPEEWTSKIDDPNEQAYTYEVKALGCCLKGAKLMPKEDVPDESSNIDNSVNNKKPPPAKK